MDSIHRSRCDGNFESDKQNRPGVERPLVVPAYFARKTFFARSFGMVLLVLFSPIILLLVLAVRLTSTGPALFRQRRLGKGGRDFMVLKIRTMYVDAEHLSGPMLCKRGDSRVTPVGRLLRFLHLDELPQLVNVARGDMCLVGPRPERPEIIASNELDERVPGFTERTRVLPGVTGLAQINLPADQTADCVIPKVKLDLEYIETAGIGLDLRILLCTAMRMAGIRHGYAVKLLGLCRKSSLSEELPVPKTVSRRGRVEVPGKLRKEQPSYVATMAMADNSPTTHNGNGSDEIHRFDEVSEEDPLPRHPR